MNAWAIIKCPYGTGREILTSRVADGLLGAKGWLGGRVLGEGEPAAAVERLAFGHFHGLFSNVKQQGGPVGAYLII